MNLNLHKLSEMRMRKTCPGLVLSFLWTLSLLFAATGADAASRLTGLTVEGRQTLFGCDEAYPRFGWQIISTDFDVVQTSYRILVASDPAKLMPGKSDFWDSGTVISDSSQWIDYAGRELLPDKRYFWKTIVTTNKDSTPIISADGEWTTGLMNEKNWKGEWIGLDKLAPGDTLDLHGVLAPRYMRHEFTVRKKLERATLHICGLGNYVAFINGRKVGDDVLTPLPTDYAKTVAYDSYDVTSMLRKDNAIGVVVAGGNFTGMVQNYQTNVRSSFGLPRLRANIIIYYTDGSSETIATSQAWRLTALGPIRNAAGYDGELFDANLSLGDWTNPGYSDSRWSAADKMQSPSGRLCGAISPNMHVYRSEHPVSIKKTGDRYLVDFGTNGAGRIRLRVDAPKGDTIVIRHAELLDLAGDELYTDNLRHARATARFVSAGRREVFVPEFTYYGFRYVEIKGVDTLNADDITRELIADRMDQEHTSIVFHDIYGDNTLGSIIDNARRGIRSNYKGMPVDCPQRDERMPWLGDRTTGCIGESYLFDNYSLYSKWARDICDSQRKNGSISDVSPAYWRLYTGNVTWPAALPFVCDMLYRQYGDSKPMADHYDNIKRFLVFLRSEKYEEGIITSDKYGDWCVPPESPELVHSKDPDRITDGKLLSTAYYIYLCRLMEKYAGLLGKTEDDVSYFANEASVSLNAFNNRFYGNGKYSNGTVTANLLPLAMNLVQDEKAAELVRKNLIDTIVYADGCHISSGVIGIQWIMRYLSESGQGDLAYRIATDRTYPGWGYMLDKGATTIWELWNGDTANPSMNSCNHVMLLGDLLIWCYEYLGGIRPDADRPGFKHTVYKPDYSIDRLSGVEVSHPTPYGIFHAKWERNGDKYKVFVQVPCNTTADIHLPDGKVRTVGSGSHTFSTEIKRQACNTPVMGWSSWNTYHVDISDPLIRSQADAMVRLGLKDVGYKYINIDDGFFGGRDSVTGKLLTHPVRFPDGLKHVADHIHSLGLKAGIYSDGGRNTCGNYYDNDSIAVGVGLYGHDRQDAEFFFNECGFDFIKIDFCGGVDSKNHEHLDLDEKDRYTAIRKAIDETGRTDVRINVCRWNYPGTWVGCVGDSWRMSHDIRPRWSSVKDIIDQNLYLSAYAGGGRYNDMDMLEVGRGMSWDEDRTHFGLWCIMCSPLLIGCDLNSIQPRTLDLLKNEELIALNQDILGLQAYVAVNDDGVYLLAKDICERNGNTRAVAIYNSTDIERDFTLRFSDVDLAGGVRIRDLFRHADIGEAEESISVTIAPHATEIFRLDADDRVQRKKYEAETAYLTSYQELDDNVAAETAIYRKDNSCSGGMSVAYLGMRPDNDIQWRDVYVDSDGTYQCAISTVGEYSSGFIVNVNGYDVRTIASASDLRFDIKLNAGRNTIRLYTDKNEWMPAIDFMTIE